MTKDTWEGGWLLEVPSRREDLLEGLIVRDLLNGASFDVEFENDDRRVELDFTCGDELEGETYHLLIVAEVRGPEDHELVEAAVADLVAEAREEARAAVGSAELLGTAPLDEVEFRAVAEEEERWDLVIPDWFAPDGAEVPFGFRSFRSGSPWPSDADLDRFSRVVLVPDEGALHAYGVVLSER